MLNFSDHPTVAHYLIFLHHYMININKLKYYRRFRKIRREKPEYWYLPQDNLGYIQIPKVASRSTRIALITHFSEQDAGTFSKQKLKQFSKIHSSHIKQVNIRKEHPDAYIFSFVRHPYARILSCYKDKVSRPNLQENIFICHNISLNDSFDTFVEKVCEIPDSESDRHFRSQSWFLMNGSTLIPDFVGKLESMATDWEILRQRFNLPAIPNQNTAPTPNTGNELSTRNKQLIQQRFHHDFVNFYSDQY